MRNRTGFTLIELLIVVAIIGMLAAIAIPNFLQAQVRAKVARVKADHRTLATALDVYFVDQNGYPPDRAWSTINGQPVPADWFVNNLLMLSTPIDYVSNVGAYPDPFNQSSFVPMVGVPPSYRYYHGTYNWGTLVAAAAPQKLPTTACVLQSFGPDHTYDGGEWVLAGLEFNLPPRGYDRIYDPTNGTISGGDIMRVVGQTKGLQQVVGGAGN